MKHSLKSLFTNSDENTLFPSPFGEGLGVRRFQMKKNFIIILLFFIAIIFSCKKEKPEPENPYSKVQYDDTTTVYVDTLDPYSIVSIHRDILSVKCAEPGCHNNRNTTNDKFFQPDFTTVQSAYATLVYHPSSKKTLDSVKFFSYRVLPFDTTNSFIHERITTPTKFFMPTGRNRLSQSEIDRINRWIMNGAKDMFGQQPKFPNTEPVILYYLAFDTFPSQTILSATENRKDSIFYNPFYVNANSDLTFLVSVEDDSTAIKNLQVNKMKMSLDINNFSGAKEYIATYLDLTALGYGEWWQITMNTSDFPSDTTVYFRYYVNDGKNPTVEMPYTSLLDPYKTWWSFYIKP